MRIEAIDRHSRKSSPIHMVPAAAKLLIAIAWIVATVAWPRDSWSWAIGSAGALIAIAAWSRVPAGFLLRRLLAVEPFVLGVAVLSLLQPGGGRVFATTVVRSTICVGCLILLTSTTPFPELLRSLRRIRVPGLLVTTLALTYRYIFVLADEAGRMRRARASRTFTAGHRQGWWILAGMLGGLFIRASERAERIYAAMCARGWPT